MSTKNHGLSFSHQSPKDSPGVLSLDGSPGGDLLRQQIECRYVSSGSAIEKALLADPRLLQKATIFRIFEDKAPSFIFRFPDVDSALAFDIAIDLESEITLLGCIMDLDPHELLNSNTVYKIASLDEWKREATKALQALS